MFFLLAVFLTSSPTWAQDDFKSRQDNFYPNIEWQKDCRVEVTGDKGRCLFSMVNDKVIILMNVRKEITDKDFFIIGVADHEGQGNVAKVIFGSTTPLKYIEFECLNPKKAYCEITNQEIVQPLIKIMKSSKYISVRLNTELGEYVAFIKSLDFRNEVSTK